MLAVQMHHLVHQQKRGTVRQQALDLVDIVQRLGRRIDPEHRTRSAPLDLLADHLRELGIGRMARLVGYDTPPDALPDQRQIANHVEQLMPRRFVRETQLQIVQIAFVDLHVALIEYFRQTVELLVRNAVLDDNDRVIQIAALDQVVVDQRLQLMQENERAARCDLLGEVRHAVEPRVLVPDDLGIEIDVHVDRELVVGIGDDLHAALGNGINGLLGNMEIDAVGRLLDGSRRSDGLDERKG